MNRQSWTVWFGQRNVTFVYQFDAIPHPENIKPAAQVAKTRWGCVSPGSGKKMVVRTAHGAGRERIYARLAMRACNGFSKIAIDLCLASLQFGKGLLGRVLHIATGSWLISVASTVRARSDSRRTAIDLIKINTGI
jgi:hypothetical protein